MMTESAEAQVKVMQYGASAVGQCWTFPAHHVDSPGARRLLH